MTTKIIVIIIISIFSNNIAAQTRQEVKLSQSYFLKARNRSSVDEHAVAMIILNGDSASSDCLNDNDYSACKRFNNAVSQLNSICYKYKYQTACDSANELQRHHTVMTILQ